MGSKLILNDIVQFITLHGLEDGGFVLWFRGGK